MLTLFPLRQWLGNFAGKFDKSLRHRAQRVRFFKVMILIFPRVAGVDVSRNSLVISFE
jgi:hypothetical protein